MSITSEAYEAMLLSDWSPQARAVLEHEQERAKAREAKRKQWLATHSEQARKDSRTAAWQEETLRVLRLQFCRQYELQVWRARTVRPGGAIYDLHSRLLAPMRGLQTRLGRARREADEGCRLQQQWLDSHAEMIAEVENGARTLGLTSVTPTN